MTSFDGWRAQPQQPQWARLPAAPLAHNFLEENRRAAYMNCAIEST